VQVFLKQSLFHLILLVAECVREFAKELGLLESVSRAKCSSEFCLNEGGFQGVFL
jgi:hypothetical protein